MAKGAGGAADKVTWRKASRLGDLAFAKEVTADTGLTAQEADALGDAGAALVEQLRLDPKWLPLAAALTVVTAASMRYAITWRDLDRLYRERHPRPAAGKPAEVKP